MKAQMLASLAFLAVSCGAAEKTSFVPAAEVKLNGGFWAPRYEFWRRVTIPDVLKKFEERSHMIESFDLAAKRAKGGCRTPYCADGQFFEVVRGASDYLAMARTPELEAALDRVIAHAVAAPMPDGYLNTRLQVNNPELRWGDNGGCLLSQHEIYNAGCLVEAGVHHYRATGKTPLLAAAVRFANLMCDTMGPLPKRNIIPSHSLAEEALVELARLARSEPDLGAKLGVAVRPDDYLALVKFWFESHGRHCGEPDLERLGSAKGGAPHAIEAVCRMTRTKHGPEWRPNWGDYQMDRVPLDRYRAIEGHAVRAALLCTGLAAYAYETGDAKSAALAERFWDSMVGRKMYVTGGIGARSDFERFGDDWELPPDAYLETCAAVSSAFFSGWMANRTGDGRYMDEFERVLYNALLTAVGEDGCHYTYQNPLNTERGERWDWHTCPCCPPMFLKLTGALPGYVYSHGAGSLAVNLFIDSSARATVGGTDVTVVQRTAYPDDGRVEISVEPAESRAFDLRVRIPGWARGVENPFGLYRSDGRRRYRLALNGEPLEASVESGYATIRRTWKKGDRVTVDFDLSLRAVTADARVRDLVGCHAYAKGPVVQAEERGELIPYWRVANRGACAHKVWMRSAPPAHLTCEYRVNPVGLDAERPRLSWWIDPAAKEQLAYRISADGLWDSGWVASSQSVNVVYGGGYPGDLKRVDWRVNVRTDLGESGWSAPAHWVTGKRTWKAAWIGAANPLVKVPEGKFVVKVKPVPWWELKVNGRNVRYMIGHECDFDPNRPIYVDVTPFLDGSGRDVIDTTIGSTWERVTEMPSLAPPAFRKPFALTRRAVRATLAITGLGFYEASLDGRRIGDKRLDPVPTAYNKRVHYSVYELGPLEPGDHALDVLLGHGWYDVPMAAPWNWDTAPWRDAPKMLAELQLEYADGSSETIASDATWRQTASPVLFDSIREGEVVGEVRSEKEEGGSEKWQAAVVAPPKGRLVAETTPGTVIARELKPTRLKDLGGGSWLVDFGENISGWMRLKLRGLSRGDVVSIRYDERIGADFTPAEERRITWHFRWVNSTILPGEAGFQTDRFVSSGRAEETYEPRFTYNGFRYALVKGLKSVPKAEDFTACFLHTDFKTTGSFDCSSRDLLDVLEMVDRAYRGNFANGYPTDCPHREKNGWTGDANLASELAQYAYENTAAYESWLTEIADAQHADGELPGIVPTSGWGYGGYGPVWDMVAAYIPDYLRRYRGDEEVFARMRGTVERVLDLYLRPYGKKAGWNRVVKGVVEVGYADHSYYKTYTRRALPNTCYAIGGCDLIGRTKMAEDYRAAARREFYRGDGLWENGSQTSQACALAFGLCADEDVRRRTGERLVEAVHRADDHVDFGIVGSKHVFRELSKIGRTDLAFKMVTQKTLPSFLYWKAVGGTTFMEELDPEKAPSQNHIMFGDVLAWAYQYLGGIRDVEGGYRRFTLAPDCIDALDHVSARVETPYGVVESAWRRENGRLVYDFTIPPGCRATVVFGGKTAVFGPGRHSL